MHIIFNDIDKSGSYDIMLENVEFAEANPTIPLVVTNNKVLMPGRVAASCRKSDLVCFNMPALNLKPATVRVMDTKVNHCPAQKSLLKMGMSLRV